VAPPDPPLIDRLLGGELRALARAITRVEEGRGDVLATMESLWDRRAAARVLGVTGPPGAGKSTLVDRIIARHRSAGRRVAVLAVDPSSPFSGGAILGDRIRMQSHAGDPGVFIRSLGTRGHHGGLTRTTREAAILCAAAGFDRILVETVGVGQTELEVVGIADQVLVLLVPESGDVVQTMKAGLLEGADLFGVNKADRPGADRLVRELRGMLEERRDIDGDVQPEIPVFALSAQTGEGLGPLLDELERRDAEGTRSWRRLPPVAMAARLLSEETARRAEVQARAALAPGGEHEELARQLEGGATNPYAVVRRLMGEGGD
jgi:LAO/AO transport system kinase